MSCTLYARKAPKTDWPWHFGIGIRDKLDARFGHSGVITNAHIPYLEGLRDASGDRDKDTLTEMIDALYEGEEIEIKMEC